MLNIKTEADGRPSKSVLLAPTVIHVQFLAGFPFAGFLPYFTSLPPLRVFPYKDVCVLDAASELGCER